MLVPEMATLTRTTSSAFVIIYKRLQIFPFRLHQIIGQSLTVTFDTERIKRLGEFHHEIHGPAAAPTFGSPEATDGRMVFNLD